MWDSRKALIFREFTKIDSPRSNLSEVIHAGWKNKGNIGFSLLESCIFDIRDFLSVSQSLKDLESGTYNGGRGPSTVQLMERREKAQVDAAAQFGRDMLDFNISKS